MSESTTDRPREGQVGDAVVVSSGDVTVERTVRWLDDETIRVEFDVVSENDRPVTFELTETIPDVIPLEDVGFHGDYGWQHWYVEHENLIAHRLELDAGADHFTLYGVRPGEDVDPTVLVSEPSLTVVPQEEEELLTRGAGSDEPAEPMEPDSERGDPATDDWSDADWGDETMKTDASDSRGESTEETAEAPGERREVTTTAPSETDGGMSDTPAASETEDSDVPSEGAEQVDEEDDERPSISDSADDDAGTSTPTNDEPSTSDDGTNTAVDSTDGDTSTNDRDSEERFESAESTNDPQARGADDVSDGTTEESSMWEEATRPEEPDDEDGLNPSEGTVDDIEAASDRTAGKSVAERLAEELAADNVDDATRTELRELLAPASGTSQTTFRVRLEQVEREMTHLTAYKSAMEEFLDENGDGRAVLEDVRSTQTAVQETLDAVSTRIDHVEQRLDALETSEDDLQAIEDALDAATARLDDLETRHDGTVRQTASNERALEALDETVDDVASTLTEFEATVTDEVEELETRVAAIDESVDDLSTWQQNVVTALEKLTKTSGEASRLSDTDSSGGR